MNRRYVEAISEAAATLEEGDTVDAIAEECVAAFIRVLREDDGAVEAMTDAMTPADYPQAPEWAGDKNEAISHQRDRQRLNALADYLESDAAPPSQ